MKKLFKILFVPKVGRFDRIVFSVVLFLLLGIGFAGIFTACIGGGQYGAPPIPVTLCQEHEADKATSVLLKVSEQYNVPLNEVYYGLIDTTRIMLITDVTDKEWIKDYLDDVAKFYNARYPAITYDQLITYMVSKEVWGEKVELALSILSTRMGYFRSNLFVNPYDNCMLVVGWTNAKKLLFIS